MTEQNLIIEEIRRKLAEQPLNGNQVAEILNSCNESTITFIDELSVTTALNFWNGKISYDDGDCIMNNLHAYCITQNFLETGYPQITWECYEAFDAGEDYRLNDDPSVDPAEKYTRPLVEGLLRRLKKI